MVTEKQKKKIKEVVDGLQDAVIKIMESFKGISAEIDKQQNTTKFTNFFNQKEKEVHNALKLRRDENGTYNKIINVESEDEEETSKSTKYLPEDNGESKE